MATPALAGTPSMVPPITTYRAYFSLPKTDPFLGDYSTVLAPYAIDPVNAGAAPTPASVSEQVYAATHQGDPTAFLLWHATPGEPEATDAGRVSLLHSVSEYTPRMGRAVSRWDKKAFATRGDVTFGTAPLAMWDPTYLQQAAAVNVLTPAAIDTALAGDPAVTLLGPFADGDPSTEAVRCRKTVYVPAPFVGLLLGQDLTPVQAWNRVRGAVVDAGAEASSKPLVDWLRVALTRAAPNAYPMLRVDEPAAPLPDVLLLQHRHRILIQHLPGLDPSINNAAGTRIAATVGEVAVELRETRLESRRAREKKENKGVAELYGENLAHLLNLCQVSDAKDLPPVWPALAKASKAQQLLALQRVLNTTIERMGPAGPDRRHPLATEDGARAGVPDGESGRPHDGPAAVRLGAAHRRPAKVSKGAGGSLHHGSVGGGRTFAGGRRSPVSP